MPATPGTRAAMPGVAGIEANARQYVPAANERWDARYPGIFTIRDGCIDTAAVGGPGFGVTDEMMEGEWE